MALFNSVGHIAFKVNDLERSIAFYEKLGFPEFLRLDQEPGKPWIAYVRVTDELYIELFPGGDGTTVDPRPDRTGLNHLCLTTDDIEATVSGLAAAGIATTAPLDPARRGVDNNRGLWVIDPDGNRIEIMEMAPDSIQFEAIRAMHAGKPPQVLLKPRMKA